MGHTNTLKGQTSHVKSSAARPAGQHGGTLKLKLRHIVVPTFKQAEQIVKEIEKGAKFEDVARKYSIDAATKANGGMLEYVEKKDVSEEFWDAADGLRVNEISDPVQDRKGFHIIMRIQ